MMWNIIDLDDTLFTEETNLKCKADCSYMCDVCNKVFKSQKSLQLHKTFHSNQLLNMKVFPSASVYHLPIPVSTAIKNFFFPLPQFLFKKMVEMCQDNRFSIRLYHRLCQNWQFCWWHEITFWLRCPVIYWGNQFEKAQSQEPEIFPGSVVIIEFFPGSAKIVMCAWN
jgi:hypothetical protein